MANTKFQIKRSAVSGRLPNTSDPSNTAFIDAGELAINLIDEKVFSSNGTISFEVGANLTSISVSGNATFSSIVANGSVGTDGQVLASNGSTVYWETAAGGGGGNTTITGFANISSTLAAGNTTVTGFINVSSTGQFGGNVTITGTTNTSVALNVGANVNLSTSTINVGNTTINSVISSSSLDLSGNRIRSLTHTSSNTDLQTFDTFAVSAFRSAQYSVQLTSGTDYHVINLSLVHDDTTVFLAQYGEIFDNVSLGTFDAAIATGNVNVQFTPTNAVTVLKAVATMISV